MVVLWPEAISPRFFLHRGGKTIGEGEEEGAQVGAKAGSMAREGNMKEREQRKEPLDGRMRGE